MKPLILGFALLCAVPLVLAGPYAPSSRFLAAVQPAAPVLPYKLGLMKAEVSASNNAYSQMKAEVRKDYILLGEEEDFSGFYADLRTALSSSGLLNMNAAERARLDYTVETFAFDRDTTKIRASIDLVMVYRFHRDGQTLAEYRVRSHGRADGVDSYNGIQVQRALVSNLHLLLVQMRANGDPMFATQATQMIANIEKTSRNPVRTVGGFLTDGFISTVEGTIDVVSGAAKVGGTMLEVAASPEFAATLDQEMANRRTEQAQQQAYYNNLQRQANEQQAQPQQPQHESRHQATGQQTASSPQNPNIRPYTPVQNGSSGTGSWANSGGRSSDGSGSSSLGATESAPANHGPKLIKTLEAISVCTRPEGEFGKFRCSTPVSASISGSSKDSLKSYRTPEAMVASLSESCPDQRRLNSTTHLVWGCGFGATNNSNSMDRSAGVDVRGRNTYYCHEKQTSCRRTTP